MTVAGALSELSGLSMAGIPNAYGYGDLPGVLSEGDLPCRITILDFSYADAGEGEGIAFSRAIFGVYARVYVLWEYLPYDGLETRGEALTGLIDDFIEMLRGNWTLSEQLERGLEVVEIRPGLVTWAQQTFVGIEFRVFLPILVEYT